MKNKSPHAPSGRMTFHAPSGRMTFHAPSGRMTFHAPSGRMTLTLIGLAVLGLAYNRLIDALTRRRPTLPGLTALQVALGVAFTLPAAAYIAGPRRTYPRRLVALFLAFAASGLPMLLGDIHRDRTPAAKPD